MRGYGWTFGEAALRCGSVIAVCGTLGRLSKDWLADWLRARSRTDSNIPICVMPRCRRSPSRTPRRAADADRRHFARAYGGILFAGAMSYVGAAAAFQEISPNRMGGQVAAVYLFCSFLFALVTEQIYGGDAGVSASLATVARIAAVLSAGMLALALARAPCRRATTACGA